MKKLYVLVLVLSLVVTTSGVALAGFNWDGDPLLKVNGTTVQVVFGIDDGAFVHNGGQIAVVAQATEIQLLSRGPSYVTTTVVQGGKQGQLLITTTLTGSGAPNKFLVRVRVPSSGFEQVYESRNGGTVRVQLP